MLSIVGAPLVIGELTKGGRERKKRREEKICNDLMRRLSMTGSLHVPLLPL